MVRVRYIVDDVDEAVLFYVSKLGFELDQQFGSAIAILRRDNLELLVSDPVASAWQPMSDRARPGPVRAVRPDGVPCLGHVGGTRSGHETQALGGGSTPAPVRCLRGEHNFIVKRGSGRKR
jgi:catechol 2,3-dioxygenase-like lactoylglutathione lyase family enzyme